MTAARDQFLKRFTRPLKIVRMPAGLRIEDAQGRCLAWVYTKRNNTWEYKMLDDEEAEIVARAFAEISRDDYSVTPDEGSVSGAAGDTSLPGSDA